MLKVFVYETEGQPAKDAAAVERAKDKTGRAIAVQIDAWDGVTPRADEVRFMDDVQTWKRERIEVSQTATPATEPQAADTPKRRGRPPKVQQS